MQLPRKQLAEPYRLATCELIPSLEKTAYRLPWQPVGDVMVFIGGLPMNKQNYSLSGSELVVIEPVFFEGEVMTITALI